MGYLISIVVFLIIFSVLILVHEFGHFYAARRAGVKVEEFGMGLPPRAKGLWKDKMGTLYSLNWIPFGGFVRMYGEDSEDEKMRNKEGSFASKSIAARTLIILAGVVMNFLLGYVILVLLFTVGTKPFIVTQDDFQYYREQGIIDAKEQVVVTDFADESQADEAGIVAGDVIVKVGGNDILRNDDLVAAAQKSAGREVPVTVMRGEDTLSFDVPVSEEGRFGLVISEAPDVKEIKDIQYPFPKALVQAGYETGRLSVLTMKMFVEVLFDLFTKAEISEQVSGPVGIAQLTHQTTQNGGVLDVLKLIALLSISLGAINVLPIPALDGGRFLSIFFEVVTRRRPDAALEAKIHAFGFLLILILILAVTYNDILKLLQ
ncbi:MAG: RIP metalloprotease [Candidatus Altimarinota bacterium]